MDSFDVCVQGSGAVGMSLALALARQGLSVAWCAPNAKKATSSEKTSQAGEYADIRSYALSASSVNLLEQLKVWAALPDDARSPVREMHVKGDAAGGGLRFSAEGAGVSQLAWIVDAAELDTALLTALRFAPHVQAVAEPAKAALQAYAQGKGAAARSDHGVSFETHAYGQVAIATRVTAQRPHQGVARQWFRSPEVLALLPFERPLPEASYGVVWSVPQARAAELLALDDQAFAAALTEATQSEAGQLELAGPRSQWPLMLAQADPVSGEGWVLLGDAAHVIHPLAGQGLNLGLADVRALCEVIAQREAFRPLGDAKLLRRYDRLRGGPVRAMGHVTDGLLELFSHPNPLVREVRNRGLSLVDALTPLKRLLVGQAMRS